MTQEKKETPSSKSDGQIPAAVIQGALGVLAAITGACIGAMALIYVVILQRESQATATAVAIFVTQSNATEVSLIETIEAPTPTPLPSQTRYPTYTLQPTYTPYPTYTPRPTLTDVPPPSATPTPSLALPFEDDFDDGPKDVWEPLVGTWRMVDGTYTSESPGKWKLAFVGDEQWIDYILDVDVITNNWNYPVRILVRVQGLSYIALQTNCCGTQFVLITDGEETVIASSGKRGLTGSIFWHTNHIKIEVRGDIYKAYSDQTLLLTAQDSTLTHGRVGLALGHSARYDNLSISELP